MLTRSSIWRVCTPVYVFRPQQLFIRARYELFGRSETRMTVHLPWGLPIIVNPREAIGYNIATQGLHEPLIAETLWRLAQKGDWTVDAGANIGQMSCVLAARAGSSGRTLSFEPHPEVFASLRRNATVWERDPRCAPLHLYQQALWSRDGEAVLHTRGYEAGGASVGESEQTDGNPELPIQTAQLDTIVGEHTRIGVLKIDVEGCELEVLRGAARLLREHAVRDVVFEEFRPFPAPTHQFLKEQGYSLFGLQQDFWGIRLLPDSGPRYANIGPSPNYLATCDPARARRLLTPSGWRFFGWTKFFAPALSNGAR